MNKAEIHKAMRSEQARQLRLLERIYLANENLKISRLRHQELREAVKTAPEAPKFFS